MSSKLLQKLDISWTVDDMFINFNDMKDLRINDLLTYEVMWYGKEVHGVISFRDMENISENGYLTVGGFITIGYTSQADSISLEPATFEKKFVITKVTGEDDNNGKAKLIEVEFKDTIIQQMKLSYLSKGYSGKTEKEIYEDYFKSIGIEDEINFVMNENSEVTNSLIPAHISAYEHLSKDWEYRGLSLIQDRYASYLVHDSHRTNDKAISTGEFFEYKPKDYTSRAQVIEYNIKGFDMTALENSIPSAGASINNENANKDEMNTKVIDSTGTGGSVAGISVKDLAVGRGRKQSGTMHSSANVDTLTKDLKNLQEMSIWVPGWNGNRLGMKVKVELPRPLHIDQSEDNEAFSGEWVVNKVRDKIINSYFIQELFLSRAGTPS